MVSDCGSLASTTVKPSDRYRPRAKFFRSTLRLIRPMPASAAAGRGPQRVRPAPLPRLWGARSLPGL